MNVAGYDCHLASGDLHFTILSTLEFLVIFTPSMAHIEAPALHGCQKEYSPPKSLFSPTSPLPQSLQPPTIARPSDYLHDVYLNPNRDRRRPSQHRHRSSDHLPRQ